MALDGIFLYSIVCELKKFLINSKIDKVNQPEKDEVVLTIRGMGSTKKLLISSSANYPRIHFTNQTKANPMAPPMFCMVLRKYLIGAKIVNIRQIDNDRILIIDFESVDELGFDSIYSLIIEIMGRHSNISLIRQRDNLIMDSIKHITPDINTYRSLYPGIKYVFPPESNKLNPFNFSIEDLTEFIKTNSIAFDSKIFMNTFNGVSSVLSKELYSKFCVTDASSTNISLLELFNFIIEFFSNLNNECFIFGMYSEKSALKDFYCVELKTLENYTLSTFETASQLLENFYFEKDKFDRLNSRSSDLQKLINNNLDRCYKKSDILTKTLEECSTKNNYKILGELLTANIYSIKKGSPGIEVLNYYSEKEEDYTFIKLDENKTPSENIQFYFKRYNKLKKSEEAASEQLEHNNSEIQYLQSVLTSIKTCDSYEEIEEIRNELVTTGYIKFKKELKNKKVKASKPLHLISSDGIDIYVGKNNFQNDFLTLKFADKNDMWLHTKDIPGSHVIIKCTGNIPDRTLKEASILAAYYSKAKDSSKVPVDYTQVKNVKKPSGAKPGMVIYYTNKTAYVTPTNIALQKA